MRFTVIRGAVVLCAGALLVACSEMPFSPAHTPATPPQMSVVTPPQVVISQVYGGGGLGGSQYLNDFVELFNPGTSTVDVTGWSVQYAGASSTSWSATNLSGSIAPGGYYLIELGSGLSGTVKLPTPDATGFSNMSTVAGKVALVNNTTRITSGTDCPNAVVDFVAYGAAENGMTCADPTGVPLAPTSAAIRLGDGCTYTGSNSADFTDGAPIPRNSESDVHSCGSGQPVVTTVTIAPDTATILIAGSQAFIATARDAGSNVVASTFVWSSTNNTVATVDANGTAKGVARGVAFIVATSANGVADSVRLTVNALRPRAVSSGPYSGVEGTSDIAMSAARSTDPYGSITSYAWDFGDGATGDGPNVTHRYAQDGTFTVTLIVTNAHALADTVTTTAAVSNVAPDIAAFGDVMLLPGETYAANGSFTDPGADSWSATVNYGDGSATRSLPLNGKSFSLSHVYAAPGSFTLTVKVSDDDATATRTQTVVVMTLLQAIDSALALLDQMVADGKLKSNPYRNHLENARKQVVSNKASNAVTHLENLLKAIDSLVDSGKLSAQDADELMTLVKRLI